MKLLWGHKLAISLAVAIGMILSVKGQEGHPMDGSWVGEWRTGAGQQNRVVIILDWTPTGLIGTINPGPRAVPIVNARVNPDDWSLHLEATGRDKDGRSLSYVIDGSIDDLGTYNRTIAGTWHVNGQAGEFSVTRQ